MQMLDDISDILKAPFVGNLDIKHLFLLVGLVIIFIVAWIFVLEHIRSAAMEVIE
jgi:hypothetical protein